MSFRKELKFKLNASELSSCKEFLLQSGSQELHPKRTVNSVYIDTSDYRMFSESEEGILPRQKHRIRWYNNINDMKYEIKTSSLEGRFKTSCSFSNKEYKNLGKFGLLAHEYGILTPSSLISYQREYYSWNDMRVTIDTKITFSLIRVSNHLKLDDPFNVMEIKAPIDCPYDYISKQFPFNTSRFSKYTRSILASQKNLF